MLFGVLVVFTSCWTVFEAEALRDNPHNQRALLEEQRIKRGRSAPPTARCSRAPRAAPSGTYAPPLPDRRRCSPTPVGYSFTRPRARRARALLQRRADRARATELVDALDALLGPQQRRRRPAHDARRRGPAGRVDGARAAARARSWRSTSRPARVQVMASSRLRPERPRRPARSSALNRDEQRAAGQPRDAGPLPAGLDVQGVTATAALDTRQATRRTRASSGKNGKVDLRRRRCRTSAARTSATIDLTTALTNSVNTVWAEVGEKLGKRDDDRVHASASASTSDPPVDYPASQMLAERRVPQGRQAARRRPRAASTSAAWRSARTSSGHAAADGDGRPDDRQRRRAHGAAPRAERSSTRTGARSTTSQPEEAERVMSEDDRRRS